MNTGSAEELLKVSEERHRLLAEHANDVIWTMSADGAITYVSPAVESMRGFTPEEAMNQTIDQIHPPDSQAISLGYFNRLAVTLTAERLEDFDFATGEILQRYTTRHEILEVQVEVPILRRLSVFAEGADRSVRSLVDQVDDPLLADFFAGLDRDDLAYRGGVRYYPSAKLRVGAGVGYAETDFAAEALERSNSGDFWYVETGYERPKLLVDLLYQENQLTAVDGSQFSDFDSSTGVARIEWRRRARVPEPGDLELDRVRLDRGVAGADVGERSQTIAVARAADVGP